MVLSADAPDRVGGPAAADAVPPRRRTARPARWLAWWQRRWRALTSMRTAIVLLFLVALAAIPGSLFPQRSISRSAVATYYRDHPDLAPVLDRLRVFDVFASPWFAAVYLLLFISLIGCLVPRCADHARALRTPPPPVPRHLHRLPHVRSVSTGGGATTVGTEVRARLRRRHFRVTDHARDGQLELSAERGRLRETGNLVFHLSLLALLVALAGGKLWGYEGSILVTEGDGFCNSFQQYDQYRAGPLVDQGDLDALCFDLSDFTARYEADGTAASFRAGIDLQEQPGSVETATTIGVNDPLRVSGTRLYVTGHGFTPVFTVTLPDGQVFDRLSAPFVPQDLTTFGSQGVVKLPDLADGSGDGFAIEGFLAPTGVVRGGVLTSVDARPLAPQVAVVAYRGYLGLDDGAPQSVFTLDQRQIAVGALSEVGSANLELGQRATLPDGTTIEFTEMREFAALQVSHDPAQLAVLISALTMLAGLVTTLLVRQERVFVRIAPAPDAGDPSGSATTTLTAAVLHRGGSSDSRESSEQLLRDLLDVQPLAGHPEQPHHPD